MSHREKLLLFIFWDARSGLWCFFFCININVHAYSVSNVFEKKKKGGEEVLLGDLNTHTHMIVSKSQEWACVCCL